MAKSIRSKRKRKMRQIKRQKNAPRELNKLKKVLTNLKETIVNDDTCKITTKTNSKLSQVEIKDCNIDGEEKMEIAIDRNKKTLQDKNGNYPVWMNGRKIKKIRANKKGKKVGKQKKLAW